MTAFEIKAKTAIGTAKRVSGKIELLKDKGDEPLSFRDLPRDLKGKILVCPGEVSKSILEKARALGVVGLICQKINDGLLSSLKGELKIGWLSSSSFVLLVVEEEIKKLLAKIEGRLGIIDREKKRLVVEE